MNHEQATAMLSAPLAQVRDLAAWGLAAHDMLAELKDDKRREQEREYACDLECEKSLLASVWLAGDADTILRLEADDFFDSFHRWLYQHLRGLVEDGAPLDMAALLRRLKGPEAFAGLSDDERDGHRGAIAELLIEAYASPANVEYYAGVLRTERLRRAAGRLADAVRDRTEKLMQEPSTVLSWAGEQIDRLLSIGHEANGSDSADATEAKAQFRMESVSPATAAAT